MVNKIIVGLILGFTLVGNAQAQVSPVPPNTTIERDEYLNELADQLNVCLLHSHILGISPVACAHLIANGNQGAIPEILRRSIGRDLIE